MPGIPTPSMSGSFQAPTPVPGSPGSRGGVPLFFTVLSKLLRMEPNEMLPGPQMSPVLRKRFATSGAHSHGCSAPQLHW